MSVVGAVQGIEDHTLSDLPAAWQACRLINRSKLRAAQRRLETRVIQVADLDLDNTKTLVKAMWDIEVGKLSGARFRMNEGYDAFRARFDPQDDCWWPFADPSEGAPSVADASGAASAQGVLGDGTFRYFVSVCDADDLIVADSVIVAIASVAVMVAQLHNACSWPHRHRSARSVI